MRYVYELIHFYEDENGDDIVTYISTYSSWGKARGAMARMKCREEFSEHLDDFLVVKYELNKREWKEGFEVF